jgi:hypothetical protein
MTLDRHNHSDTKQANCQIKYRLVHLTPDALQLRHLPIADCARYDSLRRAS